MLLAKFPRWRAACCPTGGDGTQLYASCLTFYDRVPSDLAAKHEDLLGAVALKAMCLLSKRPYLASSQQVGEAESDVEGEIEGDERK